MEQKEKTVGHKKVPSLLRWVGLIMSATAIFVIGYLLLLAVMAFGLRIYIEQHNDRYDEIDRHLIDRASKDGDFIGEGLVVKRADAKWDWLLADLDSLAQKSASEYELAPDDGLAHYRRGYEIKGDIGFIWSWRSTPKNSEPQDVFLIYLFHGHNGFSRTIIQPSRDMTIDEVIIVGYFSSDKGWPETDENSFWQQRYPDDAYLPEPLGYIGDEFYRRSEYDVRFVGRISSVLRQRLSYKNGHYRICRPFYENCVRLPDSFAERLMAEKIELDKAKIEKAETSLKFTYGPDGEIDEVLSAVIFEYEFDTTSDVGGNEAAMTDVKEGDDYLLRWPVPDYLLGAGSMPFKVGEEEFDR
ncbi:hypothetical protein EZV61_15730 [Corallincola luteus]|uniref:Uncharacterized protein n=1 Tax=Corallincola luteus TaxID=1775177 RepID=A0ABY2ALB0_9GAMM|nr:hypothetical protein [Corallincola luteus]TCI02024.1 hypothetical protein EZV61_15730 [Corallincola luteus]